MVSVDGQLRSPCMRVICSSSTRRPPWPPRAQSFRIVVEMILFWLWCSGRPSTDSGDLRRAHPDMLAGSSTDRREIVAAHGLRSGHPAGACLEPCSGLARWANIMFTAATRSPMQRDCWGPPGGASRHSASRAGGTIPAFWRLPYRLSLHRGVDSLALAARERGFAREPLLHEQATDSASQGDRQDRRPGGLQAGRTRCSCAPWFVAATADRPRSKLWARRSSVADAFDSPKLDEPCRCARVYFTRPASPHAGATAVLDRSANHRVEAIVRLISRKKRKDLIDLNDLIRSDFASNPPVPHADGHGARTAPNEEDIARAAVAALLGPRQARRADLSPDRADSCCRPPTVARTLGDARLVRAALRDADVDVLEGTALGPALTDAFQQTALRHYIEEHKLGTGTRCAHRPL